MKHPPKTSSHSKTHEITNNPHFAHTRGARCGGGPTTHDDAFARFRRGTRAERAHGVKEDVSFFVFKRTDAPRGTMSTRRATTTKRKSVSKAVAPAAEDDADVENDAVPTTRDRAMRVNADATRVNDAVALLRTIDGTCWKRPVDEVFDALCALETFFGRRLASGELAEARRIAKEDAVHGGKSGDGDAGDDYSKRAAYLRWFEKHYKSFVERALRVMTDARCDARARTLALACLMECARCETPGTFSNELYDSILRRCVTSATLSEELLGALAKRYLTRVDVRYFTYASLRKIVEDLRDDEKKKTLTTDGGDRLDIARNVYDVLNAIPRNFEDFDERGVVGGEDGANDFAAMLAKLRAARAGEAVEDDDDEEAKKRDNTPWCKDTTGAVDLDAAAGAAAKKKRRTGSEASSLTGKPKWMDGKRHRRMFSDAWLALLRSDFPPDIYRKILTRLHVDVMPHMVNAQLLSDFCVNSIDIGGLTGMLALNGLFVLMTQHGLEYPTFYNRLYELLDSSCFHANHRRGFFQLMDVFLKSPALPAYLVASFIKRFARLSLSAPPAGALTCVGFIHNLLRRHKSCVVLVHRPTLEGEPAVMMKDDPFLADERDPAKTNALKSSLWEMETMRSHYFPQIPKMVSLLERDLTDRVKTKELEMGDLVAASYGSLMAEELDVRLKKVPLATPSAQPFTSIFTTPEMLAGFSDAFSTE